MFSMTVYDVFTLNLLDIWCVRIDILVLDTGFFNKFLLVLI